MLQPTQRGGNMSRGAQGGGIDEASVPHRRRSATVGTNTAQCHNRFVHRLRTAGTAAFHQALCSDADDVRHKGRRGYGDGCRDQHWWGRRWVTTRRWFSVVRTREHGEYCQDRQSSFDCYKTYVNNAANDVRALCGFRWSSSSVFIDDPPYDWPFSSSFRTLLSLFCRIIPIK